MHKGRIFRNFPERGSVAEVLLEQFAPGGRAEFVDGLVLDLSHAFAGESELVTDVFQRLRMFDAQTPTALPAAELAR